MKVSLKGNTRSLFLEEITSIFYRGENHLCTDFLRRLVPHASIRGFKRGET